MPRRYPARAGRDNRALKTARAYHRAGYKIIPLEPLGKAPLNRGGLRRPPAWSDFETYAERHPALNFGVLTGSATELCILDVDGAKGEASLAALEAKYKSLPKTVIVKTGKGRHIYFYSSSEIPSSVGKLGGTPGYSS